MVSAPAWVKQEGLLQRATAYVVSYSMTPNELAAAMVAKVMLGDRLQICGATDHTACLQAAVDSLPVGGGDLYIGYGAYTITALIDILNRSHVRIILDKNAVLTLANLANCYMFRVHGQAGAHAQNFELAGGVFDCNKAGQTPGLSIGLIEFENFDHADVHHILVKNSLDYAVACDRLVVPSTSGVRVAKSTFLDCEGAAYLVEEIADCDVDNPFIGSTLSSVRNCRYTNVRHSGCYIDRRQHCVDTYFTVSPGGAATAVNIEYAKDAANLDDINVEGNIVDGTGGLLGGVSVSPNMNNLLCKNINIMRNRLRNVNWAITVGASPGVVGATIHDINIDENIVDTCSHHGVTITINDQNVRPNRITIGARNKFLNCALGDVYPQGDNISIEVDPVTEFYRERSVSAATLGAAVAGTGGVSGNDLVSLDTGANAGSSAAAYYRPHFLGRGYNADYDKRYILEWEVYRWIADANAVAYLKMDDDAAPNDPNSRAVGFKVINLDVWGVVYNGGGLHTVNLGLTIVAGNTYRFRVIHCPGVGVFWFIDGVYMGMSTDEPAGVQVNGELISVGLTNGASAVAEQLYCLVERVRRQI